MLGACFGEETPDEIVMVPDVIDRAAEILEALEKSSGAPREALIEHVEAHKPVRRKRKRPGDDEIQLKLLF